MKNAYAAYYYLKDNKLIKSQYVFSKKEEKALIKSKNINNLADYYIYDDNPENDQKAKELLIKEIYETKDVNHKYFCMMTLTEYYFTKNDLEKVKQIIADAKPILLQVKDQLKSDYELIYNVTNDMYKLMVELN